MKEITDAIRKIVNQARESLFHLRADQVSLKIDPDKWSKKEILGHLIDSAANNHQRFVRAGYNAAGAFPPYDQNEWVRIQHYQDTEWNDLVALWSAYNHHLCHIIECTPKKIFSSPCNIGKAEPVTLEFVIQDYLRHLKHHLNQILGSES